MTLPYGTVFLRDHHHELQQVGFHFANTYPTTRACYSIQWARACYCAHGELTGWLLACLQDAAPHMLASDADSRGTAVRAKAYSPFQGGHLFVDCQPPTNFAVSPVLQ